MNYGKIVREKLIREEVDLDEIYKRIEEKRGRIRELETLSDNEKVKEWERLVLLPLKMDLKDEEEEFNKLLKEKDGDNIQRLG